MTRSQIRDAVRESLQAIPISWRIAPEKQLLDRVNYALSVLGQEPVRNLDSPRVLTTIVRHVLRDREEGASLSPGAITEWSEPPPE